MNVRSTKNTRSAGLEMLKGRWIKRRHNTGQRVRISRSEPFAGMGPRVEPLCWRRTELVVGPFFAVIFLSGKLESNEESEGEGRRA